MLTLESMGTVVFFVVQSISNILKKFHVLSACQVFMGHSHALEGCTTGFSLCFSPNLIMSFASNLLFGTQLCCRGISKLLILQPPFWGTNVSLFTHKEILALQMSEEEPHCP